MTSAKLEAQKEKVAKAKARQLRQIANFMRDTAKEAAKPMYANRVLARDFDAAMEKLTKASWEISDIIVPRDPKTGYADARKLLQAVFAHAFRPQKSAKENSRATRSKSTSG